MKKLLFFVSAALVCCLVSCSDKKEEAGGMSDKAKKNLEAMHTVAKAFETGDISGIDSAIASDFIDHTDKGDAGRDSLKAMITAMYSVQNDMKSEVIKEFADDEYVFSWMRYTGTSDGSMGMPKGPYNMTAIEVAKFRDGKAIEHWSFMEPREMMKMMGGQEHPTMDNKTDTTKKSDSKM
ncbi:MAG: ester cyclase [Chitinophagaceae bacterium]